MTSRLSTWSIVAFSSGLIRITFVAERPVARPQTPVTSRAMALTFDDLPFVAAGTWFTLKSRAMPEISGVVM
jgi:hypothetical protein